MNTMDPQGLPSIRSSLAPGVSVPPRSLLARLLKPAVLSAMSHWHLGRLEIHLPDGSVVAGGDIGARPAVSMWIHNERAIWQFALRGDVGVGESYVNGDWQVDDLPGFIELALRNQKSAADTWLTRMANVPDQVLHAFRRNTPRGSRRNIERHYDLSNELFALFLDPSLTYSSAVFATQDESLAAAQERKFSRFGERLQLGPDDHVLEIGCGWGAFARFAARTYGCRVTGLTISARQLECARERVQADGLGDRVAIEFCDYRQASGRFTKIVSIEMLEAVGRARWATFFGKCHELLAENGLLGVQVITVPDHRFEAYARRCDWIQKYIFPGGILPSLGELCRAMSERAPFSVRYLDDIGLHYAETLARWRRAFLSRTADVRALNLDDRFIRMWDYYLASCEGAFRAQAIGDLQLIIGRAM